MKILVLIVLLIFLNSCHNNHKIEGRWVVIKAAINNDYYIESDFINNIFCFKQNSMIYKTSELANDSVSSVLKYKDNGNLEIISPTNKDKSFYQFRYEEINLDKILILESDEGITYYLKKQTNK